MLKYLKKKWPYIAILLLIAVAVWCLYTKQNVKTPEIDNKNNKEVVKTPEEFGANGYDNIPDTQSLQKAIDNSSSIKLKDGATYIIDKPLISNHSITISTAKGAKKSAIILQKHNQSALIFNNKRINSTYVTENVSKKQSYVVVKSTNDMEPGDLFHLKSKKLWYWDNRSVLHKGELHKITKIEGNKVYLDRPAHDNYNIHEGETVKAATFKSHYLRLHNITFKHLNPSNTVMVKVNYASDTKIDNVSILNSKETGIFLNKTYGTSISNVRVELGTTKEISTGYGIQDYGGTGTLITKSTFKKVRRGVDFSGDIPSRYGIVKNSRAYGSGKGTLALGNSGFGTHSTAEYITFQNNYIENFDQAFVARGNYITIKQNTLQGISSRFVFASYGDNLKLLNNVYKSKNGNQLESFILLRVSYLGSIIATENIATDQNGLFLKGNINQLSDIKLEANNIKSQ